MLPKHDNALPHRSLRTWEHFTKMGWTLLPQAAFSPDLLPLDFYLLRSINDALLNDGLESDNSEINELRYWLRTQDKSWYRQGMHALIARWRKTV
ncbi:hypothetical protein ANN_02809 [Periplaneta americana]|uniref:Mariner Mos1 transposase n=1 Tax=Periplaneta americana TaxID=6978 RepID=A0ABQ8TXA4_PERAM|nr:hypothetical protein ANN_02809 [Periplaneta americana]